MVFSWSYRRLDAGAARMFRLLALHPGDNCADYAAAALADTDRRAAAAPIGRPQLGLLGAGQARLKALVDAVLTPPDVDALIADSQVPGDVGN